MTVAIECNVPLVTCHTAMHGEGTVLLVCVTIFQLLLPLVLLFTVSLTLSSPPTLCLLSLYCAARQQVEHVAAAAGPRHSPDGKRARDVQAEGAMSGVATIGP